jgi:hypothetical protein
MNQQLLRLVVLNDRVIWEVCKCELEGNRQPLDGSDQSGVSLDREELTIKTITLLADLQQLVADMRRSAKWDAKVIDSVAHRVVEMLGEHLYRFLFRGELPQKLNTALNATVDGMLRIELEFQGDAEERYACWPWEYLRSPREQGVKGSGQFLALCAQLVLNRHLSIKGEAAGMKTGRPPLVLLVVAGPPKHALGDFGIVQADKVVLTLRELHAAKVIDLIELVEPEFELSPDWRPTASWEAFKAAVASKKPDVIHFIGHGRRVYDENERSEHSELIFVGPGCNPQPQRDTEFVQAVAKISNLKLVVLQACETGVRGPYASATSVGQLLAHHGIPAVVAMQTKVENIVANDFAEAFYKALREHKPIDVAVREGREAIQNVPDPLKLAFGVPVLYLRSYEAMTSPTPTAKSTEGMPTSQAQLNVPSRPFETCPRCSSSYIARVCEDCQLRVVCACGTPLVCDSTAERSSPMRPFCSSCGRKIVQQEWSRLEVRPVSREAIDPNRSTPVPAEQAPTPIRPVSVQMARAKSGEGRYDPRQHTQ